MKPVVGGGSGDDRELKALLAEAPRPIPSPEFDARMEALFRRDRRRRPWTRLLFGGVRVPVPVLAGMLLVLLWALFRPIRGIADPEPRPRRPPEFSVMAIEAKGYVAVTEPTVRIRRRQQQEEEEGGAR